MVASTALLHTMRRRRGVAFVPASAACGSVRLLLSSSPVSLFGPFGFSRALCSSSGTRNALDSSLIRSDSISTLLLQPFPLDHPPARSRYILEALRLRSSSIGGPFSLVRRGRRLSLPRRPSPNGNARPASGRRRSSAAAAAPAAPSWIPQSSSAAVGTSVRTGGPV
ncbi:hypothetical protein NL676_031785 [Syzygium grande]|nr:hypothetical protein NL676_031785 [Syzygium grande]